MLYECIVKSVRAEKLSLVPIRWATWIFITGDITCFLVQGNAAGLLGNDNQEVVQIGNYIIIVGLILQIIVFICFLVCCGTFHRRMGASLAPAGYRVSFPWEKTFYMLYVTSTLFLARNVYRVVEFVMQTIDDEGYLITHEWPLFAFDSALMVLLMLFFYIWYPCELHESQLIENERSSITELNTYTQV